MHTQHQNFEQLRKPEKKFLVGSCHTLVWGCEEVCCVGVGKERCVGECKGEWGSVLVVGGEVRGNVGKCVGVWDPNTLSPTPFPTSPPSPQRTSLHLSSHLPLPSLTPQHTFPHLPPHFPTSSLTPNTLPYTCPHTSPYLLSRSQNVAKLPCDKVSVAKFLASV